MLSTSLALLNLEGLDTLLYAWLARLVSLRVPFFSRCLFFVQNSPSIFEHNAMAQA